MIYNTNARLMARFMDCIRMFLVALFLALVIGAAVFVPA